MAKILIPKNLTERLEALEETLRVYDLRDIEASINPLENEVDTLRSKLEKLEDDFDGLAKDLKTTEDDLNSLTGTVDSMDYAVNINEQGIKDIDGWKSVVDDRLDELENKLED